MRFWTNKVSCLKYGLVRPSSLKVPLPVVSFFLSQEPCTVFETFLGWSLSRRCSCLVSVRIFDSIINTDGWIPSVLCIQCLIDTHFQMVCVLVCLLWSHFRWWVLSAVVFVHCRCYISPVCFVASDLTRLCIVIFLMFLINRSSTLTCVKVVVCYLPSPSRIEKCGMNSKRTGKKKNI